VTFCDIAIDREAALGYAGCMIVAALLRLFGRLRRALPLRRAG